MKHKLLLLSAVVLAVMASGCKKEDPTPAKNISVLPTEINSDFEGGTFDIAVSSTLSWVVTSDQSWAIPSINAGTNNGNFKVVVKQNTVMKDDYAIVMVITTEKDTAQIKINRGGVPTPTIKDICGNIYQIVTIDSQTWMVQNMKCDQYDTESEAYNATWLTNNTVPTSSDDDGYTPYYTDATDKSKWNFEYGDYTGNLSNVQIAKLGYLYNWAATVGVENGYSVTTPFEGNRQGICPNGWHVPAVADWSKLQAYIIKAQAISGKNVLGKYLKTTSGWYENGNGLDSYGFAALPSGCANVNSVYDIGNDAYFWTANPNTENGIGAYCRYLDYQGDYLSNYNVHKGGGRAVRCVKN